MHVIWNGALERAAVEAERTYAPREARTGPSLASRVLAYLQSTGPVTQPDISEAMNASLESINSVMGALMRLGKAETCGVQPRPSGRALRVYRAVAEPGEC